jgi:hypothetical protein
MKQKLLRILAVTLILSILLLGVISPVYAISSTPDILHINQCDAYQYLKESGDMGFFIDFTITYPATPVEPISDTYVVKLMNTDGTTEITSTIPYAFFNNGYNRGVSFVYLTAGEVTTLGISYGDALVIRLDGNPAASWDGAVPSAPIFTLANTNWSTASTQGQTRLVVEAKIRSLASGLQTSWNDPNFIMITNYASGSVLTTNGESYFSVVIPDIGIIAPNVLSSIEVAPEYIDRQYTDTNEQNIQTGIAGTALDMTNLANVIYPGLDPIVITSILALVVIVFIAMKTRDATQNYKPIVLVTIPVIVILTKLGWISMMLMVLLVFLSGVLIFYTFFYEKSSG